MIEDQNHNAVVVCMGLEILNKKAQEDPFALDRMAEHGGREVVHVLEEKWYGERMIDLHATNLKRRLRRSKAKSKRIAAEINLPPDDVIRIRGCWEYIDEDNRGWITPQQLGIALQMLGMKMTEEELEEATTATHYGMPPCQADEVEIEVTDAKSKYSGKVCAPACGDDGKTCPTDKPPSAGKPQCLLHESGKKYCALGCFLGCGNSKMTCLNLGAPSFRKVCAYRNAPEAELTV